MKENKKTRAVALLTVLSIVLSMAFGMLLTQAGCAANRQLLLSGTVEYTQYDVFAQAAGQILAVHASEGDSVEAGALLANIDNAVQLTAVRQAQAQVSIREERLAELKAGSRTEQIAQAEAVVAAAKAQYEDVKNGPTAEQIAQAKAAVRIAAANRDTARTAYNFAKDQYNEAKADYDDGILPAARLDDARFARDTAYGNYQTAQEQYKLAQAQLAVVEKGATPEAIAAAKAQLQQATAGLNLLKSGSTAYTLAAAQDELDAATAQLIQAELLRDRCEIRSPASGILTIIGPTAGSMISAGGYFATIADPQDLWMHVYIPQSRLKLVSLQQAVPLTTTAWPGETFQGTVVFIASTAEFTPKNTATSEAKENTVFKLKIRIDDPDHKLRAGMTLDAAWSLG